MRSKLKWDLTESIMCRKEFHSQKRNENDEGKEEHRKVDTRIVAFCDQCGITAHQRRRGEKDADINVADGVDKIRSQFFFINRKHNVRSFQG